MMQTMKERSSGVLLHPTSLPGPFGIGDLGDEARIFLDWLETAGQRFWQVLPLGPTGHGNSPYNAVSAFAGNPLLISPHRLVAEGLLDASILAGAPDFSAGYVRFAEVREWKRSVLRASWERFKLQGSTEQKAALESFSDSSEQAFWLEDWCLFAALKMHHDDSSWRSWPSPVRLREPEAIEQARVSLEPEISFQRYLQYLFWHQWSELKAEANARGIQIFGDVPIYVALDSAEVWSRPELFELDAEGRPLKVAGVPPDYFSATGQLWGNPIYRWDRLAEHDYGWWVERLRNNLRQVDLLRLDHFRGFAGYWEVDAEESTAINGEWVAGPGQAFFDAVRRALGELPLVAEDLGVITPDVVELRDDNDLPGMKVLQFGFFEMDSDHLPHHVTPETVYYTGTHDNDTVDGWFAGLDPASRNNVLDYLGTDGSEIHLQMIRGICRSTAWLTIVPAQDLLGFDGRSRMNTPGVGTDNWEWRLRDGQLDAPLAAWLRRICALTGRLPDELEVLDRDDGPELVGDSVAAT